MAHQAIPTEFASADLQQCLTTRGLKEFREEGSRMSHLSDEPLVQLHCKALQGRRGLPLKPPGSPGQHLGQQPCMI